ncbi:MAG: DUF1178 family protein [Paracoccaceae bacterium]|nr:DUF1178 family protein [Paracoccaceae bacterium]
MIRYALRCAEGHDFESWFASGEAFDTLAAAGQLACPECGARQVDKALMAPKVRPADKAASLTSAETEKEKALAKLRTEVEKNSDYVGLEFAAEARAMHEGERPHRSIYGEAKPEDAKALIEDGVPVAPLPFTPRAKTN